jgi:hypothetical protein
MQEETVFAEQPGVGADAATSRAGKRGARGATPAAGEDTPERGGRRIRLRGINRP